MTRTRLAGSYRLVYRRPGPDQRDDDARRDADRQTMSLAGLAAALAVLVLCLFLFKQLSRIAAIDDCLLSGQHNCDLLLARLR